MVGVAIVFVALVLTVLAGLVVVDEGRKDLKAGVDGHTKIIAGVCITSIAAICVTLLTVVTLGG